MYQKTKKGIATLLSAMIICSTVTMNVPASQSQDLELTTSSENTAKTHESVSCTHHTHDKGCGYREAESEVPCEHELEDGSFSCDTPPIASPSVASPSVAARKRRFAGCTHKDGCGYVPAVKGTECQFVCEICNKSEDTVEVSTFEELKATLEGNSDKTVIVMNDIEIPSQSEEENKAKIDISNANMTLDLNGHTLTYDGKGGSSLAGSAIKLTGRKLTITGKEGSRIEGYDGYIINSNSAGSYLTLSGDVHLSIEEGGAAIWGGAIYDLRIQDRVRISAFGRNTTGVSARPYGGSLTIDGDVIISGDRKAIRYNPPTNASASLTIKRGVILGDCVAYDSNGHDKLLEDGNKVYGDVTLPGDVTIPAGYTLTVLEDARLTIPSDITLTNEGTLAVDGIVINEGSLDSKRGIIENLDNVQNDTGEIQTGETTIKINDQEVTHTEQSLKEAVTAALDEGSVDTLHKLTVTGGRICSADWEYLSSLTALKEFSIAAETLSEQVADMPQATESKAIFPASIQKVTIPQVAVISSYAFSNCASLTSAEFYKVSKIDTHAFYKCTALTSLTLPTAVPQVHWYAFKDAGGVNCSLKFTDPNGGELTEEGTNQAIADYKEDIGYNSATGMWYIFPLPSNEIEKPDTDNDNGYRRNTFRDPKIPATPGTWQQTQTGWKFVKADGSSYSDTWIYVKQTWYWIDKNGVMQTGWVQIAGRWYYLSTNGAMLSNTKTPDGYRVDANGVWVQ